MFKIAASFFLLFSSIVGAQEPQLKGGLSSFLKDNTVYPNYSLHNCIQGAVQISFKLNHKGEVYYSTVTKSVLGDLDEEALRLVRVSSGKWEVSSTHDTTSLIVVPINFILEGYDCSSKTKNQLMQAISAYQNREGLQQVVVNFYRNKENGTFKPEDEVKIAQIKTELEIDDEYLDERVNAGLKKYKQGDKQGACEDFIFVKYMGSNKADNWLAKYCK